MHHLKKVKSQEILSHLRQILKPDMTSLDNRPSIRTRERSIFPSLSYLPSDRWYDIPRGCLWVSSGRGIFVWECPVRVASDSVSVWWRLSRSEHRAKTQQTSSILRTTSKHASVNKRKQSGGDNNKQSEPKYKCFVIKFIKTLFWVSTVRSQQSSVLSRAVQRPYCWALKYPEAPAMSQYYSHDHEPSDSVTHVIFDVDGTILDTEELYNKAKLQVCIIENCAVHI